MTDLNTADSSPRAITRLSIRTPLRPCARCLHDDGWSHAAVFRRQPRLRLVPPVRTLYLVGDSQGWFDTDPAA